MGSVETGSIISKIRKEKNMTQKELANLLNVSDKAVSKWERGEGYPDIALLPLLSDVLGVSIDELLSSEKANEDIVAENKISYQYLIEDCEHQFDKNWFYSYCLMALAMFTSLIMLPYSIAKVLTVVISLFALGLFYFFDKKYKMSMSRYKYYLDSDTPFLNIKPYYQILITVAIQCLLIIMISSVNDKYIKEGMINTGYKHYIMLLFIYTADIVVLWGIFIKYRENISKVNKKIIINSSVNLALCIEMIIFKVCVNLSRHVKAVQFKFDIIITIIFLIVLMVIGFIFSLKYLKLTKGTSKDRKKLLLISVIQNLMILLAFMSVTFKTGGLNNNVYCYIYLDRVITVLLVSVVCYYFSNIIYERINASCI